MLHGLACPAEWPGHRPGGAKIRSVKVVAEGRWWQFRHPRR